MAELKLVVPSELKPPLNTTLVTDEAGLRLVAEFLTRVDIFTVDLETNFTNEFFERYVRVIIIGNREEQYVIDLLPFAGSKSALIASQGNFGAASELLYGSILNTLRPYLESNRALKCGTNLQFDYEHLFWNLGVRMWHLYDAMLAEKVIYAGKVHYMATGFWGLEHMYARYCGLKLNEEETGKTFDLETPLTEIQITYCGLDGRIPIAVRQGQLIVLEKDKLLAAAQIEFDAVPAFGDMRIFGFKLDFDAWMDIYFATEEKQKLIVKAMDKKFIPKVGTKFVTEADIARQTALELVWRNSPSKTDEDKEARKNCRIKYMNLKKQITAKTNNSVDCEGDANINYGSNKQLKETLWKMGFSKKSLPNTNDRALEKLAKERARNFDINKAIKIDPTLDSFGVIDLLRLYRSTDKMLTTYGRSWVVTPEQAKEQGLEKGFINPFTGRIHSNIMQLGAATARTTSSNPNVQNLPRDSVYRFCFVSRAGHKLVTVDMSGAELRILAELSKEPVWVEAFKNGWDVHSIGAAIVFGQEWIDGTEDGCSFASKKLKCSCKRHKELRQIAKTINFMLAYGGGPQKLADEEGLTFDEADEIISKKYKPAFPTVTKYLEKIGEEASTYLESRCITGFRRRWNKPTWDQAKARAAADHKKFKKPGAPGPEDIRRKYSGFFGAIRREGMNAPIQGANAEFLKLSMGCGFDSNGKPFLWHTLWPVYKAMMVSEVHDELITEAPDEVAEEVKETVGDAFIRASAEWMKTVAMDYEGSVGDRWEK